MKGNSILEGVGSPRSAVRCTAAVWTLVSLAGAAPAAPPPGLLAHFDFDRQPAADGVIADRSGGGNDARLAGAKWSPAGKTGGGIECFTPHAGAEVGARPALRLEKATLALWFRPVKDDSRQRVLLQCGALRLLLPGDPKERGKVAAQVNDGPLVLSDATVPNGEWRHAAATFDGGRLKLYLDGLPQRQVADCKIPPAAEPAGLHLGMEPPAAAGQTPPAGSPDCLLDEAMVFGRALAPEEVKAVVLAVDPKAGTPKAKFTRAQVAGQIRTLDLLYQEGLLTDAYYTRKVRELEAAVAE